MIEPPYRGVGYLNLTILNSDIPINEGVPMLHITSQILLGVCILYLHHLIGCTRTQDHGRVA